MNTNQFKKDLKMTKYHITSALYLCLLNVYLQIFQTDLIQWFSLAVLMTVYWSFHKGVFC